MEGQGDGRRDLARYARDKAEDEEGRARKLIIVGLILVIAIGVVVWAVVTIMTGDSETNDAIEDPVSEIGDESPPPNDFTPPPLPTVSPTAIPTPTPTVSPTAIPTPTPAPRPIPIEGVRVNMAQGTWLTSHFTSAIYHALLLELGYDVNDPAQETVALDDFYQALAEGEYDFWANGWFPHQLQEFSEAGLSGIARRVGWQMRGSGLWGIQVDKATADAYGITKLDDIGEDPGVAALFDLDGNGKADLMGCNDDWSCRVIIDDTIAFNGWEETIEQKSANHETLIADSLRRYERGEPILVLTWSPSPLAAQLMPGTDMIWLSMDTPLPSREAEADLPVDHCPGQPCKLGFAPADIRVVARNDFLAANPAAAKLFELVTISPADVSQWALQYERGESSSTNIRAAANQWIADNRDTVDRWIAAAFIASGLTPPEPEPVVTPAPVATPAPEPTTTPRPTPEPAIQTPEEGAQVKMARAYWWTGFLQAAIYRDLLIELGYDVSDPAQATLAPETFYPALARGEYDFWVNGWFPHHDYLAWDSFQSDIASPVGWQMQSGGLQGFMVDKATASAYGITKLDDIGDNPRLAALFDLDGDGKADLMGCNHDWGCYAFINETIAANGWQDTIEQVSSEHITLFTDSVQRHRQGQALLQYAWSPSTLTAQLVPGRDVIWLSMDNPLPNESGVANIPAEQCPGQPCKTGFTASDIRVVARNDFLAANPAAAKLFELVTISAYDVSHYSLQYDRGSNTEFEVRAAASRWIAANRAKVDAWLAAARTASGQSPARAEPEPESASDSIVAGFIFASPVGDAGWTWSHDQGRRYAERQTGATTLFVENIPETKAEFRPVAIDLIENEGADIIFGTAFGYMDAMEELASEYPEVVFEHATGFKLNDTNFGNYFGRIYQPRYLSGMAAGVMTESDRIGYVAASPIPEAIRGINAFTLGVRRVNPDAEVHVHWTFTWFDPGIEAQVTAALLDDGADVITMYQDSTASGLAAQEAGARWISYHSDMSAFAPDAYITAAVWNWGPYYESVINAVAAGTYSPGSYWGGMPEDVVGLAPLADDVHEIAAATIAVLDILLRHGTWDVFTGEIRDQDGNVVVPRGETLDDVSLLGMDYFVEGVVGSPQP
ncbi:MAG: glycine betaine/L-proline ABC transporter substrate-binding protein ProX [bacterium]|nr:glycine betaine/L-proline ABC transporter substrate-binding protein ProX [bacterium]